MTILIEVANPRHRIGTIDKSIPGAQELIDLPSQYYKDLFTDDKGNLDLTKELLFYEMLNAFLKQVQTHEQLRDAKEKKESEQ